MKTNPIKLTVFVLGCSLATAFAQTNSLQLPIADGPFVGTKDSLTSYSCPKWFRDAKFGIWAHWGPQAVPMEGDWYARKMYIQGDPDYKDHLQRWGHPSTNGWKDIIPLWKAEKWEPEKLMKLYKKAGAKYFVSMASHHDNFFLWNSKLHRWNSVEMGPHRDVVGEWQKAAKQNGLPFGVSEHLGASFTWFQTSHGADKTGPLAGVPYDGVNSNYWDLYQVPTSEGGMGYTRNPRSQQLWFDEIKELVDNYKPDLLYTDGRVPFNNEVGLSQIANFYNLKIRRGKTEAVHNFKQPSGGCWAHSLDIETFGMEKALAYLAEQGFAGVKIDFLNSQSQETVQWCEKVLATAAKHRLLVDFHGTYKPTGLARTYPNFITQEGVLGNEYNKLPGNQCMPAHGATLPFTRALPGPMDFTPGGFLNRAPKDFKTTAPAEVMGTRARQLAMTVIYPSPLLVLCDSPQNYRGQAGVEFLRGIPTVWDDSVVIQGDVGKSFVVARRSGEKWYLVAMNGDDAGQLQVSLSFLGKGKWTLHGFADKSDGSDYQAVIENKEDVNAKTHHHALVCACGRLRWNHQQKEMTQSQCAPNPDARHVEHPLRSRQGAARTEA